MAYPHSLLIEREMMSTILAIGDDLALLATRAAVLRQVAETVDTARPAEIALKMERRRYDLLVLCHTVEEQERARIVAMVRRRWPWVRIMAMVRERWLEHPAHGAEPVATSADPVRLLERTREVLDAAVQVRQGAVGSGCN